MASSPGQNAPDWTGGDWTGGFPSQSYSNLIHSPLWRYTRRDIRAFAVALRAIPWGGDPAVAVMLGG